MVLQNEEIVDEVLDALEDGNPADEYLPAE